MKISVIITVYNRLKYLRNILLALNEQTLQPFEVIIADDGSREDLKEAIIDILPRIKYNIKHVYQEDIGFRAARSRNNGARVAEGEYLFFLDQDVLFDKNFLSEIEKNIKVKEFMKVNAIRFDKDRSDKVNYEIEYNNYNFDYGKIVKKYILEEEYTMINKALFRDKVNTILFRFKMRNRGVKLASLAMGIHKKDFVAINGFDEKYIGWGHEDDDICNRFYSYDLIGRNIKVTTPIVHMWHNEEKSKEASLNEEYYYQRKKKIFKEKEFKCEYGYNNMYGEDKYKVNIIKK